MRIRAKKIILKHPNTLKEKIAFIWPLSKSGVVRKKKKKGEVSIIPPKSINLKEVNPH